MTPLKKFTSTGICIATSILIGLTTNAAVAGQTAEVSPNDWPQYHRTSNAWRHSPLKEINKENINKLKVAWIHQPGDIQMGLQATPIVIDGIAYYIAPNNNVFALDAATGKTIWHYQPDLDPIVEEVFYVAASRGVTVGHGNVYIGSLDGRFIAVDQKTGKEKWSTQVTDLKNCYGCLFSSPPQLAGDILFGGTTGGDQPQRGKIYAVNAITGKAEWTFDTIKDDPKSWPRDSGDVGGGGAWLPGTYDEKSDTIFIGTSNAAPDFYGAEREGDNKYTSTLLALEPKTGKLKWHHQEIPHDEWDYDAAYEALIVKNDKGEDVIVHLSKSGFVSVLAKNTGEVENVWPLSKHINFVEGVNPKTGELINRKPMIAGKENIICPYLLGARSWNHGAYNPDTGLWYTNAMEACNVVVPHPQESDSVAMAGLYLGVSKLVAVPPPGEEEGSARLDARDPITGKLKWSVDYDLPGLGSVLTTAGGLVFNGDSRGLIHAYDADDGEELWSFNAGSGIRGGIVSYAANGKQYILVSTGFGSHAPGFMASVFPEVSGLPGGAALVAFTVDSASNDTERPQE